MTYLSYTCDCHARIPIIELLNIDRHAPEYIMVWIRAYALVGDTWVETGGEIYVKLQTHLRTVAGKLLEFQRLMIEKHKAPIKLVVGVNDYLNQLSSHIGPLIIDFMPFAAISAKYPCMCGAPEQSLRIILQFVSNEWFTFDISNACITLSPAAYTLKRYKPWGLYGEACNRCDIGQAPCGNSYELQLVARQFARLTSHMNQKERWTTLLNLFGIDPLSLPP
jgi:hypothetical protein